MIPELPIAMLACARIGARTRSSSALSRPIHCAIASTTARRRSSSPPTAARGACDTLEGQRRRGPGRHASIESVVVAQRSGEDVNMVEGRDKYWNDLMGEADTECPAEEMDSEDILYILYSSGSTASPRESFTPRVATSRRSRPRPGGSSIQGGRRLLVPGRHRLGHGALLPVYGPLSNGATTVQFEGTPSYPGPDRHWDVIERNGVTIYYSAPTVIRAFMKQGTEPIEKHDLSSLRLLGTVGEPINPRAWEWYRENIGGGRCPVVDTWWQTETGGIMIAPLPGLTPTKPGSATRLFPGIFVDIYDEDDNPIEGAGKGNLVVTKPGQVCYAPSTRTPSVSARPTGRGSATSISSRMVPSGMRMVTTPSRAG